jgi:MYXO-CTERM domain-containing protein
LKGAAVPRSPFVVATLAPTAALAHAGPHLHPHGAELPVLALLALAAVAVVALWRRR